MPTGHLRTSIFERRLNADATQRCKNFQPPPEDLYACNNSIHAWDTASVIEFYLPYVLPLSESIYSRLPDFQTARLFLNSLSDSEHRFREP